MQVWCFRCMKCSEAVIRWLEVRVMFLKLLNSKQTSQLQFLFLVPSSCIHDVLDVLILNLFCRKSMRLCLRRTLGWRSRWLLHPLLFSLKVQCAMHSSKMKKPTSLLSQDNHIYEVSFVVAVVCLLGILGMEESKIFLGKK